ncbi:MAG: magnesium transporter [Deltaproteobacteria bacterium]|nr:MAG: magnesium transporter [Deltaproteobacteria bacterium]
MSHLSQQELGELDFRTIDPKKAREIVSSLHPADAAEVLSNFDEDQLAELLQKIDLDTGKEIFEFLPPEKQKAILPKLKRDYLTGLISVMSPDDRADLVEELDEDFREEILSTLVHKERQNIQDLIKYEENTAGAFMTTDYAFLWPELTIREAWEHLRQQAPIKETIYYVYVVDRQHRLIGILSLRDIIMAEPEQKVGEVMDKNVIAVRVDDDIEHVAMEMNKYDFLAMPVVDLENRLVGMITFDDIFDVMTEEATEDMYHLANLDIEEQISTPVIKSVMLRVPWLLLNLATALLASYVVSLFSETISKFVALAALMPIVAGMGGNAGTQTLTVTVRSLTLGELKRLGNWYALFKEARVGFLNGLVTGIVMGIVAFLWFKNPWLGIIICTAMLANMLLAGIFGALVPIALNSLRLDPALGSSIFVTTATDVGGFFTFLGLATILMNYLLGG